MKDVVKYVIYEHTLTEDMQLKTTPLNVIRDNCSEVVLDNHQRVYNGDIMDIYRSSYVYSNFIEHYGSSMLRCNRRFYTITRLDKKNFYTMWIDHINNLRNKCKKSLLSVAYRGDYYSDSKKLRKVVNKDLAKLKKILATL